MRLELESRELYGEGFYIEPLYDAYGEASFLLGTSDLGFAIIERKNGIVYECGEASPYYGFEPCRKYYGGALSYYVRKTDSDEFFNIVSGVNAPLSATVLIEESDIRAHDIDDPGGGGSTNFRLTNSSYITQYAFGYNADGTCNVVAFGIALNYLKRQHGFNIFNGSTLLPERFNGQFPYSTNDNMTYYPKAEELHQVIKGYFGMPLFAIGQGYCNYGNDFLAIMIPQATNRPTVRYRFGAEFAFMKSQLELNRPIIVSTLWHPDYGNHTMAVYGCRTVGNTKELLVHTGWHNRARFSKTGNQYTHKDHWLNAAETTYCYYFGFPADN